MIQERKYRLRMGGERFISFRTIHKETDLWIGVDRLSYKPEMEILASSLAARAYGEIAGYGLKRPEFLASFDPIPDFPGGGASPPAPPLVLSMMASARAASVGPMAAVAGAVAEEVGRGISMRFELKEILVENGGDDWLSFREELEVSVFAGDSPLSERIGIKIPPGESPLGVCTSSGTAGPSFSFGKADAVMVACAEGSLADAYATAIGNLVLEERDIEPVLEKFAGVPEIRSILIIKGERMGIRGLYPLAVFSLSP